MHHIYHTEGLILDSRDTGEEGKSYAILTDKLGLIYAKARGVRTMSSKLRFVLTDFAYVKADLVQGRREWRITSASKTGKLEGIIRNREALKVFGNIARLLRRLLVAAEPNEKLFREVVQGLQILENSKSAEDIRNIEAVMVLRMLHNLGYIGQSAVLAGLVASPLEEDLIYKAAQSRKLVLEEINKALRESHL